MRTETLIAIPVHCLACDALYLADSSPRHHPHPSAATHPSGHVLDTGTADRYFCAECGDGDHLNVHVYAVLTTGRVLHEHTPPLTAPWLTPSDIPAENDE